MLFLVRNTHELFQKFSFLSSIRLKQTTIVDHTVVITMSKWAISATLSSKLGAILLRFSLTKSQDGKM